MHNPHARGQVSRPGYVEEPSAPREPPPSMSIPMPPQSPRLNNAGVSNKTQHKDSMKEEREISNSSGIVQGTVKKILTKKENEIPNDVASKNELLRAHHHHHHHHHGHYRCVLHPNSKRTKIWQFVISMLVLYVCFIIPFDISFSWWLPTRGHKMFWSIMDIVFWVDMLVSFRTGYVHSGHIITNPKKIAHHYLQFWFWIDLLANMPWEILMEQFVDKSSRKSIKIAKWLKLPRLLRLSLLRRALNNLTAKGAKHLSVLFTLFTLVVAIHFSGCFWILAVAPCGEFPEDVNYFEEVNEFEVMTDSKLGWHCSQDRVVAVYFQSLQVGAHILFGGHVAASGGIDGGFYRQGGFSEGLKEEIDGLQTQLCNAEMKLKSKLLGVENVSSCDVLPTISEQHADDSTSGTILLLEDDRWQQDAGWHEVNVLQSHRRELMSRQGSSNVWALKYWDFAHIVSTFWQMVGVLIVGALNAALTKVALNYHYAETKFRRKAEQAKKEVENFGHRIAPALQEKLQQYFKYRFLHEDFGSLQVFNPELIPRSLRLEIAVSLYHVIINEVPWLTGANADIIGRICLNLSPELHMPVDRIYLCGEQVTGFYFVEKGTVVLSAFEFPEDDYEIIKRVHHSQVFGEEDLLEQVLAAAGPHWDPSRHKREFSAYAATVCRVMFLPYSQIAEICHMHPTFVASLWEQNEKRTSCNTSSLDLRALLTDSKIQTPVLMEKTLGKPLEVNNLGNKCEFHEEAVSDLPNMLEEQMWAAPRQSDSSIQRVSRPSPPPSAIKNTLPPTTTLDAELNDITGSADATDEMMIERILRLEAYVKDMGERLSRQLNELTGIILNLSTQIERVQQLASHHNFAPSPAREDTNNVDIVFFT